MSLLCNSLVENFVVGNTVVIEVDVGGADVFRKISIYNFPLILRVLFFDDLYKTNDYQ